ncbi:hypothetical protein TEA_017327 [Camellia sinensis var. sinensis]|uniref:HECT-type E3 ubiquitin transferase n=1 Tax=Camellia sinensis var. sinensis TaxID=542762 RepID=A0A4V3WNW5_CAMSN|nr:hypothetical protein TEA_017327 [Camellia sinensis var. sinensis]
MQAAQSVCQVEMVGERPCIVLLKDRGKDKCKEKEKEKEKAVENDKTQTTGKAALGNINSSGPGNGQGKLPDTNLKNVKVHRKPPQSFVNVIELLLDSVITFVPPLKDHSSMKDTSLTDMDIDTTGNKGKGKAVVSLSEEDEVLLMYSSSIRVLLHRDAEVSSFRGPAQHALTGHCTGGIFHHILHKFLPYSRSLKKEKKTDIDWKHKLASRGSQFLVASCVRSTEARKRIFMEVNNVFNEFVDSCTGFRPPGSDIPALIDLINDVVAARTPTGSYISAEASATCIDVGLVRSLTRTLQVLDLDHPESPKVVTGLVKSQLGGTDNGGNISESMETSQQNQSSAAADHIESFDTVQNYGGSEAVTDDVEHDQDLDGGFDPANEDDYMHETPEDTRGVENSLDTVGLEEGINGINVLDHIEVFGRDYSFANDTLHVMPVEVFGSRRQGRTTSIYNLLGRTGDNTAPSQHPLLVEPSSSLQTAPLRQSDSNIQTFCSTFCILFSSERDVGHSDRNSENNSSRLDVIFRSLRNGRQGHRFNLWTDDTQQTGGSNASAVPQGLEDLLVYHLRRPVPEKPSDQNTIPLETQSKGEVSPLQESAGITSENPAENNGNSENNYVPLPSSIVMDSSGNADTRPTINESLQGTDLASTLSQSVEMQFEHNDAVVHDVEAVSQESNGSGATFGESLRSLDVEIGSADGHDDGGERQGSADTRTRRTNLSFANSTPVSGRDASLHSVTEVSEDPSQEPDQGGQLEEQQVNGDADSASIDPTFLDALPEELHAEVLSAQQGQVAQPSNAEPQNSGEIDPEFLAALPPDIREEVLAQQEAQRLHQSQELEGQPVEMDTVSIIATFPSELREEVLLTSSHDILANLTPALVAEASMGESSRRGEGIGSSLDRAGGIIARRSMGSKPVEAEGAPLVDTEALRAMVRLFRVVQPLYKGQLQRLLLNLCVHNETITALVKILIDMLMLDIRRPVIVNHLSASEPSYRLYACQSNVMYSRPQSFDEHIRYDGMGWNGVPSNFAFPFPCLPLLQESEESEDLDKARGKALMIVEEDVMEGKNHLEGYFSVVMLLSLLSQPLYLRSIAHLEQPLLQESEESEDLDKARGKALMIVEEDVMEGKNHLEGYFSVVMLLSLLSQPLYLRSIAHLEQLLSLFDVIVDNAESKSSLSNESGIPAAEQTSGPHISTSVADINTVSSAISSDSDITASKPNDDSKPSASSTNAECDTQNVLDNLPQAELRLLCSLLAREGFGALWLELSACISKVESYSDSPPDLSNKSVISAYKPSGVMPPLPAGTQNILPYIESFFVICEKLQPGQSVVNQDLGNALVSNVEDAATSTSLQKTSGSALKADEKHLAFVKFSEKHRKLLNSFIRQNPGLLEKSFSLMLKVPCFIYFDNKRAHFRSKIKHQHDHHHSTLRISVRRAYILEDSYNQLRMRLAQDLKGRLNVHFQGEEAKSQLRLPNGASLVGKALFDGQLLDVHFTRSFYKHILGVKVTYHDIEAIDPDYFKNLKWMLENNTTDVLDLTYSIDADEEKRILYKKTEVTDYELIPGGRNIRVTEENKHEYVDLVAEHRLTTAIRPQITAFLEGFSELIPSDLISIFNDKELELLISGLPDIDCEFSFVNTEYSGYSAASPVIQWFWEVVQSFSKEDKARLLQFVTGTSKVPLEGFSTLQGISGSQKFQIHKAYGSPDHLPSAHTCFNQLDLPEYPSKQHLEERLLLAIHEANEGFGFG